MQNKDKIIHRQVGARDGLQFEDKTVSVEDRLQYIEMLIESGEKFIEFGSLAHEKVVPNMVGSLELAKMLKENAERGKYKGVTFSMLVMHEKYLTPEAIDVMKDFCDIALVTAASEQFCKNNMNQKGGIEESKEQALKIIERAKEAGIKYRGYVSTIFKAPSIRTEEGLKDGEDIHPKAVGDLTKFLISNGCYEVSLGDTTGAGDPKKVDALMKTLKKDSVNFDNVCMHLHDTGGNALYNALVAYRAGVRRFDTASGGLGQCKFSNNPKGNLATEDLVHFFNKAEISTGGIRVHKTVAASKFILDKVGRESPSMAYNMMKSRVNISNTERLKTL
ncbi:MAG: hypothetical protein SFT90_04185 [Rickettsiales bacterium]|nr:hypothetical protein [Rickettsiales bacterium]